MLKNLVLALVSFVVLAIGGEVAFRLYDLSKGRGFWSAPVILPFRTFGPELYADQSGLLRIKSRHGEIFSLEKPPDVTRIVTFGGSTSVNEWTYAEHGVHYSSILGDLLRSRVPDREFEVINVANEAYATPHSIIQLALNVLFWHPDIVVLSHNFNDLTAAYFEDFRPNYSHKFSHEYYSMRWGKYTCRSLRLCRFVTSRLEQIGFFGHPVERRSYGQLPPVAGRQTFERNLRSFVTLAETNGIKTVLGSQPMETIQAAEFDRDMATKPYNRVVKYPLHSEFVDHHRHYNHIIEMVANETGAIFVDQNTMFDGKPNYFEDFIHYSKSGVEQLARNYADAIMSTLAEANTTPAFQPNQLSNLEP